MCGVSTGIRQTLLSVLCALLRTFSLPSREGISSLEFAKQLLLGALERVMDTKQFSAEGASSAKRRKKSGSAKQNSIEAEIVSLVVACARDTPNPQTRSAALLVLSRVAQCWPHLVLHTLRPDASAEHF